MAKLQEHLNCPNPVQYGSSPVKTVYVRDTDSGKTTWRPVGFICTGCGVFRSKPGWFPSGETDPVCDPWQPSREDYTSPGFGGSSEITSIDVEDEDPGRPRVTIPKLQKLLGISREEVIAGVESGDIPIEKDKHRHWSVSREWYDGKRVNKNEHPAGPDLGQ